MHTRERSRDEQNCERASVANLLLREGSDAERATDRLSIEEEWPSSDREVRSNICKSSLVRE